MGSDIEPSDPAGPRDSGMTGRSELALRSCEVRLIASIRNEWALQFGSREVRLIIEYQDGAAVLIRVMGNRIAEEKLK